jgi:DMSO reductase anchor subunit
MVAFILRLIGSDFSWVDRLVIFAGCASGFSLVFGISRLYRLRTVPAWDNKGTTTTFLTTSLLTGVVAVMVIWLILVEKDSAFAGQPLKDHVLRVSDFLVFLLVGTQAAIFGSQMIYLNNIGGAGAESVRIVWQKLRGVLFFRWISAFLAVGLLIFRDSSFFVLLACSLLLASEVAGRFLFFGFYQRVGY